MNITVIGTGRWGSCIAWYCASVLRHDVVLCGQSDAPDYIRLAATRENDFLKLPENIVLTDDKAMALAHSDYVIVSIGAQNFRTFLRDLVKHHDISNKTFILCMKGMESATGKRLTEIFEEETGSDKVAVWVGPGHVQDYYAGRPSCMIIASHDIKLTKYLVSLFNSKLIRFYYSNDLIGCEIGAAAKNVMGIAAGMLDGFDFPGLKGALMARGAREVARLIEAMGGEGITAYGLAHLGDYQATLFSEYSHNRMYGEKYIRGEKMERLAEGVDTSTAMVVLGEKYSVDLPISKVVNDILFKNRDPHEALESLFDRENKFEF
ncbi:MAG: NAD(P)H-dependent glycerol-3-phosphate dehydrogenase [Ruminococcaceae bacterium]|nr:NAD(P)H-dependent glycerol-3-phosphate dehydrogenase [Oscillospiraceae bacterium]